MSNQDFEGIMEGLGDALAIAEGRADPATYRVTPPETIDVRSIRHQQGMTQAEFAARYGFALGRVRDWEQGRTMPEPPLRILLAVIAHEPEAIVRALNPAINDNHAETREMERA